MRPIHPKRRDVTQYYSVDFGERIRLFRIRENDGDWYPEYQAWSLEWFALPDLPHVFTSESDAYLALAECVRRMS
jgi:hypothetical protein